MSTIEVSLNRNLGSQDLEQRSVNAIRVLAMDAVQKAKSGHPGAPMGLADVAYVLWSKILKFDPAAPDWPDRDRFVLSAGHACMLQYAMLHLLGYDLPIEEIQNFRQWESRTPGHPEHGLTPGIETTTGPLGQGLSTAVGMAMAERHLAARLNTESYTPVDHHTYVIVSDGDMMEGVQSEAASMAGHLGLGKLVVLYDANGITIDGGTDLAFDTENVGKRYEAYGWTVTHVDGHNREGIETALRKARADTSAPSLIVAKTHIALGAPNKQDTSGSHGSPLGEEEIVNTKKIYGWPQTPSFFVPEDVRARFLELGTRHRDARITWEKNFQLFRTEHPDRGELWDALHHPKLPTGNTSSRPVFDPTKKVATRVASKQTLDWLFPGVPALIGGSADLTPSNLTQSGEAAPYSAENPIGRYIHYGIREHAMAAAMNGMALHGGVLPYGGTFLVFSDYMRPAIRISALTKAHVIYVFTHDSVFLGEDGPTHQPIAHLASLRAIPNLTVIRPSDPAETVLAWEVAIEGRGPVALSLTRQGLPPLDIEGLGVTDNLRRGAYILLDCEDPELIAFATGSEVFETLTAGMTLQGEGARVRVVAVPSWELFFKQDQAYQNKIMAPSVTNRISVEAGSRFGWERFVGLEGHIVGMKSFGASAPWTELQEKFGFTAKALEKLMRRRLNNNKG